MSNDGAFFEGRDWKRGRLAEILREEAATDRLAINVYPSIDAFMTAMAMTAMAPVSAGLDEEAIAAAIVKAVEPLVYTKVAEDYARLVSLTVSGTPTIHGYSPPTPSALAISFAVSYDCTRSDEDKELKSRVSIRGSCSYNPTTKSISEIEVNEWHDSLPMLDALTTFYSQRLRLTALTKMWEPFSFLSGPSIALTGGRPPSIEIETVPWDEKAAKPPEPGPPSKDDQ